MRIKIFTQALGWHTIHKKCGPVTGKSSLNAEISGCSMVIESLTNVRTSACLFLNFHRGFFPPLHVALFIGLFCTRVDRNRAPRLASICGSLLARVGVVMKQVLCVAEASELRGASRAELVGRR